MPTKQELKPQVVALINAGYTSGEICRKLSVSRTQSNSWLEEYIRLGDARRPPGWNQYARRSEVYSGRLSAELPTTPVTVEEYQIPQAEPVEESDNGTPDDKERSAFQAFLSKGRTSREIVKKFGSDDYLTCDFPGYKLFVNLNNYQEKVYILLPIVSRELDLKPKEYTYHQHFYEDGEPQCYLLVNIDETKFAPSWKGEENEIRLVPLFDTHIGHHAHKAEKFLSYLDYIENTPNVYTWLGGDIMENALDDGRGMTYEQMFGPSTQLDLATCLLARVAHKCLFAQPGNHELRTEKKTNLDPTKVLSDRLKIPYFAGPVFCTVVCGERRWRIHSQHGHGNSQTKGGKMNSAGRPRRFTDCIDFFVSGHVHDPMANPEQVIREDPVNCRLIFPSQWTVIAPSFLGWDGTYAQKAGYAPPGAGGVSIHLYESGHYEALLRDRA